MQDHRVDYEVTLRSLTQLRKFTPSLQIPPYQREVVWSQDQVLYLFDSLQKGYPIGTLSFWQPHRFSDVDQTHVIDGQQRLTAITGLRPGTSEEHFQLRWDLEQGRVTFEDKGDFTPPLWISTVDLLAWYNRMYEGRKEVVEAFLHFQDYLSRAQVPIYTFSGELEDVVEAFRRLNTAGTPITQEQLAALTSHH